MNSSSSLARESGGRVTVYDVAREAGVTYTTVSNVLNGKGRVSQTTRAAVLKAVENLDYHINPHAQKLARGFDGHTIALVALFVDFDVVMRKLQVVQSLLQAQGFATPLHSYGLRPPSSEDETRLLAEVRQSRPRAIVCYSQCLSAQSWRELELYRQEGGHVVFFDQPCEQPFDRVLFDREHNTYEAARHLLNLGHRHIVFWMSAQPRGPRLEGFRRALREEGVPLRDEWLFHGGSYLRNEESGAQLAEGFLSLAQRPTGMCIVNDSAAHAFMAALHRAGLRVPGDVSVVGHDDTPIARYGFVPMTTMSHPAESIAHAVLDLLQERINGDRDRPAKQVVVRGELTVRQSTTFVSA